MPIPYVTALTAGCLIIMQMVLGFLTSGARSKADRWVGHGDDDALLRATRRHGNLAENAAIFVTAFLLLELSALNQGVLVRMCGTFLLVRVLHAIGLSRQNTGNLYRLVGGVGTYLLGFALGGILIWVALLQGHLG